MEACLSEVREPVLAVVCGKPITQAPTDLFIPPDALEVLLDSFSGPLDLLLYLIRKQNLDILDIPIALITEQYLHYIQLIESRRMELAADYLLMAAMLAEIKSRLLLPVRPSKEEEQEEDPRMELVRKLQAYEQMKQAAMLLDERPRWDRDCFRVEVSVPEFAKIIVHPAVELDSLLMMMQALMKRQGHEIHHQIAREVLSVRERMSQVLLRLEQEKMLSLDRLHSKAEGRMGVAVSLLAILELARQSLLRLSQANAYAPIYIMAINHE